MQHLDDDLHLPKQNVETQSLCTLPLNASWLLIRRLCELMSIGPTSQVNSTSCVPMSIRTTWNRICYRWRSGPRWRFVMRKGRRNCRQSFAKMGTPHWLCKERNIARSPVQHQGLCGWNRWTFPNIALPENAYAIGRKRLDISPRRGVALQRLSTVLIGGSVSAGIGWIFGRNKRLGSSAKLFFRWLRFRSVMLVFPMPYRWYWANSNNPELCLPFIAKRKLITRDRWMDSRI